MAYGLIAAALVLIAAGCVWALYREQHQRPIRCWGGREKAEQAQVSAPAWRDGSAVLPTPKAGCDSPASSDTRVESVSDKSKSPPSSLPTSPVLPVLAHTPPAAPAYPFPQRPKSSVAQHSPPIVPPPHPRPRSAQSEASFVTASESPPPSPQALHGLAISTRTAVPTRKASLTSPIVRSPLGQVITPSELDQTADTITEEGVGEEGTVAPLRRVSFSVPQTQYRPPLHYQPASPPLPPLGQNTPWASRVLPLGAHQPAPVHLPSSNSPPRQGHSARSQSLSSTHGRKSSRTRNSLPAQAKNLHRQVSQPHRRGLWHDVNPLPEIDAAPRPASRH